MLPRHITPDTIEDFLISKQEWDQSFKLFRAHLPEWDASVRPAWLDGTTEPYPWSSLGDSARILLIPHLQNRKLTYCSEAAARVLVLQSSVLPNGFPVQHWLRNHISATAIDL